MIEGGEDEAEGARGQAAERTGELRSFGRRRGRKPSPHQQELLEQLLPRVRLDLTAGPTGFAPGRYDDIWLEIGFGGGEHLVWQARHYPRVGLVGCEPYLGGVLKVLAAIDAGGLDNVRIHDDDARSMLRALPDASIGRAFVLFPDPWPKMRHRKRRLVDAATVAALARVLKPGAELRLGTDIGDYATQILLVVQGSSAFEWLAGGPDDWRRRPADWPATRYEQKALREGRRCTYLRFRRNGT
jgi:tRNA (guanine-N7-)-methyltransferase